ncbi:Protein THEMIS [Microtus ochrogaster]|uniref:Protein THEMIS n=1 Tax=Microtus ochrogaster TaxID=79684 RepID=A0A8J6KY18_MICOH|nr:Protein THEMIS [Microtus ochrogaster]
MQPLLPMEFLISCGLGPSWCGQSEEPRAWRSHHADRVKKLRPAQGGLNSRIPVGFRNDLVDVERQKNKQGPLE